MSVEYVEATVAVALAMAGATVWGIKTVLGMVTQIGVHTVRLDEHGEDAKTTAEILSGLVPTVAALEERTKRM